MFREKEVTLYDPANKLNISIGIVVGNLKDDPIVRKRTMKKIFELAGKMGFRSYHLVHNLRKLLTNAKNEYHYRKLRSYYSKVISEKRCSSQHT